MPSYNYDQITYTITQDLYPVVAKSLDKNYDKFKGAIADFMNRNSNQIYDVAPYDNIYHGASDVKKLLDSLELSEDMIDDIMSNCFYWKIPMNPAAAKEPYVVVLMCAIRYFLINRQQKDAEICAVYMCFSGKFYASIYTGRVFTKFNPSKYKGAMDYAVNTMLTGKYDLKSKGTMFGAILSMCQTWLETYQKELTSSKTNDREVALCIQQIRDREAKFLHNIANLYYKAYKEKLYINYETDNLIDGKEFRITDNDSLKATRYTQDTITFLTTNAVSLKLCNACKDVNLKDPVEIKDIMESIISDNTNLPDLTRVINIIICDFMRYYPDKTVGGTDFLILAKKPRPNTKDEYIIEMKSTILKWLDENSPNYRRRKSREATANSYYKAILYYLILSISAANR